MTEILCKRTAYTWEFYINYGIYAFIMYAEGAWGASVVNPSK